MLAVLAQCETTMKKSVEVYNMNLKEQENYERLNEKIGKWLTVSSVFLKYGLLDNFGWSSKV